MKYAFFRAHQKEFPIRRMCEVLQVSRSGTTTGTSESFRHSQRDNELLEQIGKIHQDNTEAYGGLRIWKAMNQAGTRCGKHRVARLRRTA